MRVLYIGTVKFSEKILKELLKMRINVVGVCTLPHSTFNADHVDLTEIAKSAGIPVIKNKNLHSTYSLNWIKSKKPDIIFCFGWSRLLKIEVLKIPPKGVIGFHPSKLPENRGRHPLIWALVLGLKETASTFFLMDEGADTGDIISQKVISISNDDYVNDLYNKIIKEAKSQIKTILPKLCNGNYVKITQKSNAGNFWRKRSINDGLIDWRMSTEAIYNLIRGLSHPYVGAHFISNGKLIRVWRATISIHSHKNIEPGKVLTCNNNELIIKTGNGAIKLIDYEPKLFFDVGTYL